LNQDYTEENEKDEFKVFLFHLIHLLQCNPGSKKKEQLGIINGEYTFRPFISIN
jgi:hypothetical protein